MLTGDAVFQGQPTEWYNMDVYAVFCVTGDTDGVAVHDLVGIARTRHAASEIIQEHSTIRTPSVTSCIPP
jgi:hypothetical protein